MIPDDASGVTGSNMLGLSYLLFDQDGKPLNAAYMLSAYGREIDPIDGKRAFAFTHDGNPLSEAVTAITFVPRGQTEHREGDSSDDYALRVKAAADADRCFTVKIQ